jgi:hypothetical protein
MNLEPCTSCRRHVDVRVTACPFCGVAMQARSRMRAVFGRASRAAVFASAAACASSTPHAAPPPPPPPPPDPVVVKQPDPVDAQAQHFATAPPPVEGKASLRGVVTRDRALLPGVVVHAVNDAARITRQATTNDKGEYELLDLEPGSWRLFLDQSVYDAYAGSRRPQEGPLPQPPISVTLEAGKSERRDLATAGPPVYQHDPGPCCKPYGAPPARRRIV